MNDNPFGPIIYAYKPEPAITIMMPGED